MRANLTPHIKDRIRVVALSDYLIIAFMYTHVLYVYTCIYLVCRAMGTKIHCIQRRGSHPLSHHMRGGSEGNGLRGEPCCLAVQVRVCPHVGGSLLCFLLGTRLSKLYLWREMEIQPKHKTKSVQSIRTALGRMVGGL